jgi:serine phosphatase RsbU (regulator of sigma subunit)
MRLRLKLVLAFFLLAVVPLAGLAIYSYYSSLEAYRSAVLEQTRQLADQMGSRIETVRHDVGRRIRNLGPQEFYSLVAADPKKLDPETYSKIFSQLEDVAVMLEDIQVESKMPDAPPMAPDSTGDAPKHPIAPEAPGAPQPPPSLLIRIPEGPAAPEDVAASDEEFVDSFDLPGTGKVIVRRPPPFRGSQPPPPGGHNWRRRQEIEMHWQAEKLKELESKARSWELQALKVGEEASKAATTAVSVSNEDSTDSSLEERVACLDLTSKIDMKGDYEATVVARINAKRLLGSVLRRTERVRGEIPFAVDPEGHLYTVQRQDRVALKQLASNWTDLAAGQGIPSDWIVSSRNDPETGMVLGIAKPIGEGLTEIRQAAARNLGYGLALVGIALIGILPLSGRMTRNLTALTKGVERLGDGDLSARVPVRSRDELGRLSAAFNHMAAQLRENQERKIEQERMRKELEMCRQIQREMLPRNPLRLPFAEVQGVSIPAREVGGDFFNYFALADGKVAMLIGDVSGKGVPAALLMANIQATLRARLASGGDLVGLVAQLDREVAESTPAATYLTLFIAVLDQSGSTLHWVNAGHNTQYVLRNEGAIEPMASSGRPVGLLPGSTCVDGILELRSGDAIFLYTDGLVEAENERGEEFGYDRLEDILKAAHRPAASEFLARIEEEVRLHRGNCETQDDATMLMLNTPVV